MAIDSKAKRMTMLSVASPLAWGHHFEVDSSVDADDRAHLLHLYGGNAFAPPPKPFRKTLSVHGTRVGKRQTHISPVKG